MRETCWEIGEWGIEREEEERRYRGRGEEEEYSQGSEETKAIERLQTASLEASKSLLIKHPRAP